MKQKIIMKIIYLCLFVGITLLLTGLFMDKQRYEHILEKHHIFDVANIFLQIGIISTAIVLILHANNIVDTINLRK